MDHSALFPLATGCETSYSYIILEEVDPPLTPDSFLNWNMPYGALSLSRSRNTDYPSPFAPSVSTPSDISVDTPPGNAALSPQNPPSPLSTALKRKTAIDRAHLFVQGRHDDLIRSMNNAERR